jgi:hypothetical protein
MLSVILRKESNQLSVRLTGAEYLGNYNDYQLPKKAAIPWNY